MKPTAIEKTSIYGVDGLEISTVDSQTGCIEPMFLRYLSNVGRPLGVIAFLVGASVAGVSFAAFAASYNSSVQTYVSEAVPVELPQSHAYYDSPLAAGTLTLEDVLEAHRPRVDKSSKLPAINGIPSATATAPIIGTQSGQPSSTGMMLSEGMKAVLQKIGNAPAQAPAATALPSAASTNAQATGGVSSDVISAANCATPSLPASGSPVSLSPDAAASPASAAVAQKAERVTIDGVVYEPGQAPKNLATGGDAVASAETVTEPEASGGKSCGHAVKKWQKTCGEAGYPETYVGKIIGETRVGCSDSALHDVWVTNTCSPPDAVGAGNPDDNSEKIDAVCGSSAGQEFYSAPTEGLCEQGNSGDVEDGAEWSWSCSGINGGADASCTAAKSVKDEDGECGEADGTPALSAPSIALCLKGNATKVKGDGPWSWSCLGSGDGDRARCSAPVLSNDAEAEEKEQPAAEEASDEDMTSLKNAAAQAVADGYEALDIGEFCGTAAEVLAYEAPSSGLCRVGRSSAVDGNGPWSWTCTDNDGKSSSCRTLSLAGDSGAEMSAAPAKPVMAAALADDSASHEDASLKKESIPVQPAGAVEENHEEAGPECGQAASKPSMKAPSSGLCAVGKAGAIHKGATWSWSCSTDKRKIFCEAPKVIDAVCGAANGKSLESEPEDGLCAQGTPSAVEGGEAWRWACKGNAGGADVSCAAAMKSSVSKIDGVCGAYDGANMREVPAGDNLCASGSASAVSGEGPWTWSCSGVNGGRVGVCSANKVAPPKPPGPAVNGLCGRSNGVMVSEKPSEGLCAGGIHSEVVGSGPWNWNCVGENGGMTVSCSAPLEPPAPIDGVCGSASGIPTLVKPRSGLCSSGVTGNVNGTGPWTWSCSGVNGGAPASCVAPVAGKTASVPSVMTTSSGGQSSVGSASGLKTPKLPSSSSVPALDRAAIPSLTPSKSVLKPPSLSSVPNAVAVKPSGVPDVAPDLPEGTSSIAPPSKPVVSKIEKIPGNRLSLDPEVSLIGFSKGSGNLNAEALPLLDKVAAILSDNADVRISLYAYADNQGSTPRAARRLSLKRAIAVRTYLVSKGIAETRMDVHAEGANVNYGSMDRVDIKVND